MSFDWREYLKLAQFLQTQISSSNHSPGFVEACQRAAISRAYYAAFCTARNYARYQENAEFRRNRDIHWAVIEYFEQHPKEDMRKIGANLQRLFIV
jgi:hypothetical protein